MKTIFLTARKLDSSPVGKKYLLAISVTPNPGLGLSLTPVSDHSYRTLENLSDLISGCNALDAHSLAALRAALQNEEPYTTQISEESALCMGFKLP